MIVAAAKKEAENALRRCGRSKRHITKLKQSIFFRYLWATPLSKYKTQQNGIQ
jgi:hypothetical protein